jgi:hypothetical protein
MQNQTNVDGASIQSIVRRLESSCRGVSVWRIMTPDGKGYVDEFSRDGSCFPDQEAREHLKKQQAKGYMIDHYVLETQRRDNRDRLIEEAAKEIKRLAKRVAELESHLATTIEMKTN